MYRYSHYQGTKIIYNYPPHFFCTKKKTHYILQSVQDNQPCPVCKIINKNKNILFKYVCVYLYRSTAHSIISVHNLDRQTAAKAGTQSSSMLLEQSSS